MGIKRRPEIFQKINQRQSSHHYRQQNIRDNKEKFKTLAKKIPHYHDQNSGKIQKKYNSSQTGIHIRNSKTNYQQISETRYKKSLIGGRRHNNKLIPKRKTHRSLHLNIGTENLLKRHSNVHQRSTKYTPQTKNNPTPQ